METEEIELIGECTDRYHFDEKKNGSASIYIRIPKRFKKLCLNKICTLEAKDKKIHNLVEECTDSYEVKYLDNGHTEIYITVSKEFSDLWLVKINELKTTMKEIKKYEEYNDK